MSRSITTTLLAIALPLISLLPLARANETFYIGYTEETGNKITWQKGQDVCANGFQTLVAGPGSEHAVPCNMAFFSKDSSDNKVTMAYTDCGNAPPQVWEVDRNGGKVKQLGSCVDHKDNESCWFGNVWDTTDGNDVVVEWECEIAL